MSVRLAHAVCFACEYSAKINLMRESVLCAEVPFFKSVFCKHVPHVNGVRFVRGRVS